MPIVFNTQESRRMNGGFNTTEDSTNKLIVNQNHVSLISSDSQHSDKLPSIVQEEILSSSSDTNGPIGITVQISSSRDGSFYFYPYEDTSAKVAEFAKMNNLSSYSKQLLLDTVEKIKSSLG